jgi:hypothetical protein
MPTKYRPQLDHVGFDWSDQSNKLHRDLLALKTGILENSGFNDEYGDPSFEHIQSEAREFIRELSGIISVAAAIRMDAGFKASNKLTSTLEAVKRIRSVS